MKKLHVVILCILTAILSAAGMMCYFSFKENAILNEQLSKLEEQVQKLDATAESLLEEKAVQSETKAETETESEETKMSETENESNGKKVAIDPGHQSFTTDMSAKEPMGPGSNEMKAKATTGTTGRFTGVPEYELNLNISKQLRTELESRGYEVVLTREDNETAISNKERALMAADEGADIYVRIHANGSESSSVSGAMTMVPSANNPYVANLHEASYDLGEKVINAYCEATGMKNNGVQMFDNMTGINWSKIPVIIIEMGFMTNQMDDENMQKPEYQEKMVAGIADGIDEYFGLNE